MTFSANKPPPTVAVVLCTHNGAHWVEQQLQSLFQQSHPVAVRVFDDASTDNTVARVRACGAGQNLQCTEHTSALGVVHNFATGIQSVLDEGFDYIALADQDDVWTPERVAAGMAVLLAAEQAESLTDSKHASKLPRAETQAQLVYSDLSMINAHNHQVHGSFMRWRRYQTDTDNPLSLVLGQNGVMGNTVLMNRALASQALPFPASLHVHDYWLAVVAELLGQRHYIDQPLVQYRIHDTNVSNSSASVSFGLRRWFNSWSFTRLMRRDLLLPYKEDSRHIVVKSLLTDTRFSAISVEQRTTIESFLRYLTFTEPKLSLATMMWRSSFLRPGIAHRLRVLINILASKRYPKRTT